MSTEIVPKNPPKHGEDRGFGDEISVIVNNSDKVVVVSLVGSGEALKSAILGTMGLLATLVAGPWLGAGAAAFMYFVGVGYGSATLAYGFVDPIDNIIDYVLLPGQSIFRKIPGPVVTAETNLVIRRITLGDDGIIKMKQGKKENLGNDSYNVTDLLEGGKYYEELKWHEAATIMSVVLKTPKPELQLEYTAVISIFGFKLKGNGKSLGNDPLGGSTPSKKIFVRRRLTEYSCTLEDHGIFSEKTGIEWDGGSSLVYFTVPTLDKDTDPKLFSLPSGRFLLHVLKLPKFKVAGGDLMHPGIFDVRTEEARLKKIADNYPLQAGGPIPYACSWSSSQTQVGDTVIPAEYFVLHSPLSGVAPISIEYDPDHDGAVYLLVTYIQKNMRLIEV